MRLSYTALAVIGLLAAATAALAPCIGVLTAIAATAFALLVVRVAMVVDVTADAKTPFVLETIPPSHFSEKVRWSMDYLGVPYTERRNAGVLGIALCGHPVPRLHVTRETAQITVANSADILRYLWGIYEGTDKECDAVFLRPTASALKLERRLDYYGVCLQFWIYSRMRERQPILQIWGVSDPSLPLWQRSLLFVLEPLLLKLPQQVFPKSGLKRRMEQIDDLLSELDARLAKQQFLLGEELSYVDITFASLSLWLMVPNFARGQGTPTSSIHFPAAMEEDMQRWRERYPNVTRFVQDLYKDKRMSRPGAGRTSSTN